MLCWLFCFFAVQYALHSLSSRIWVLKAIIHIYICVISYIQGLAFVWTFHHLVSSQNMFHYLLSQIFTNRKMFCPGVKMHKYEGLFGNAFFLYLCFILASGHPAIRNDGSGITTFTSPCTFTNQYHYWCYLLAKCFSHNVLSQCVIFKMRDWLCLNTFFFTKEMKGKKNTKTGGSLLCFAYMLYLLSSISDDSI